VNRADPHQEPAIHWPSLLAAILMMLAGTGYPLLFARGDGHADHRLALLSFWAMSAGFVRGVGFIPRHVAWRMLLSGRACLFALALAALTAAWPLFTA
jgi:predicted membrane protein